MQSMELVSILLAPDTYYCLLFRYLMAYMSVYWKRYLNGDERCYAANRVGL